MKEAGSFFATIGEVLAHIPPREAMLWIVFLWIATLYRKSCDMAAKHLQEENQRLVEEKKWLWEQLKQQVPNSGLLSYNQVKGSRAKK